jgi:DNA helicase HerA-like ATPase
MSSDFEIGRVVAVDTAQVTIELTADLKALTRTTYEGAQEVGRINSYVVVPIGARRLVGMVTRVMLVDEAEMNSDRTMVTLPIARRRVKATLIGTIDDDSYTQGVAVFPILDNPVHLATSKDLNIIFDCKKEGEPVKPHEPGFCIRLGDSPIFEGFPIHIDPDAFFGKHAAVLGSTGSGKSCTIASLLQSILAHPQVKQPHLVILDTNGEYRSAFQKNVDGKFEDVGNSGSLYIPSDPTKTSERLTIPYWFMNADDFVRLFGASQGVQRPVLLEALRLARNEATEKSSLLILREELARELNHILALVGKEEKTSKDLRDLADGLASRLNQVELDQGWTEIKQKSDALAKDRVLKAIEVVKQEAVKRIDGKFPQLMPADARKVIVDALEPILTALARASFSEGGAEARISADTPAFFDKQRFRTRDIEQVLRREESGGARARDFSGTMLLRIDRLLSDRRFEFLLGPTPSQFPNAEHSHATFLRDILGLKSATDPVPSLSDEAAVAHGQLPFYDRQRAGTNAHKVVILDLNLLAAEVLENVTALIGRLVLEFLQRLGEVGGEEARGSLPIVLVLEEAQNYIGAKYATTEPSISQVVFERIAREGRKYGLGLVVASQRPSELSKTVLSQCSSFIVHRLQNPEDLRYFKEIVPGIYGPLLDQLPALAPQTALVMGECVRAPAIVRIREARPVPRSRDPKFFAHWAQAEPPDVNVEKVCAIWQENLSGPATAATKVPSKATKIQHTPAIPAKPNKS